MKHGSILGRGAAAITAALVVGCVALPMQVYVADGGIGSQVYERCSLNPEVPVGFEVERLGVHAIASVVQDQDRAVVRVQFDVPEGTTLILQENTIRVDERGGDGPRVAAFANVNPAAPARIPETPAIRKLVLPVDAPLRGGRVGAGRNAFDKHYWIAAPLAGRLGPDVWITLPEFTTGAGPTRFQEIHFSRRFVIGQALFNC